LPKPGYLTDLISETNTRKGSTGT